MAYFRDYNATHRTEQRDANVRWTHGITQLAYQDLFDAQQGACAICGVPGLPMATMAQRNNVLVVDHDHGCCEGNRSCGRCIRGLLCTRCNVGLGAFRDDPAFLHAARSYLTDAKKTPAPAR